MITNGWVRITALAAALVALAAALFIVRILYAPVIEPVLGVLLPLSIALALALLLDPTIDRMQRRGLSRGLSVAIVAIAFIGAFAVLLIFLVPVLVRQAAEMANNLPKYFGQVQDYISRFISAHQALLRKFHLPTTMEGVAARLSGWFQDAATASLSHIGALLGGLLGKAVWLILIPIVTIFLVVDMDRLKAKALLLVPERHRERTAQLATSVGRVFGAYIRGLVTVAFLYGIVCGAALALWKVPYAVMLGAAAGALSLVPYIGTISTLILVVVIALVSAPAAPLHAVWVAITILVLNQLFDNLVSPKVVGRAVGIHPALAIVALLIGARLFGIVGMILAVPAAASVQIIVLEFYPPLKGPEREEKPRGPSLLLRLWRRFRWKKGMEGAERAG